MATDTKPSAAVKRLAQQIFDSAVDNVGGGRAWVRMTPGCQSEQITLAAFDVIAGRFDAEANARPVMADVMQARGLANWIELQARHG